MSASVPSPTGLRRVEVSVEAREVGARDVKPDSVSGLEHVARFPEGDNHLVSLVGSSQRGSLTESR